MDWFKVLKNILKIFVIIVLLCLTIFFAILNLTTGATIFAIFTMFFTLFFYGNNFEIVELLGAKFKLKELNNSINELKDLSLAVAEISLTLIQQKNQHLKENNAAQDLDYFEKINNILNNVNVSKDIKEKIFYNSWHKYILSTYFEYMCVPVHNEINASNLPKDEKNFLMNKCCLSKDNLLWVYNEAKKKNVMFSPETSINMDDFEYYNENHKHKDIQRWIANNKKWELGY